MPDRDAYSRAIDGLPPFSRLVFLLHCIDELPLDVIAARLSCDAETVEAFLAEALAMIDAALSGDRPTRSSSPFCASRIHAAEARWACPPTLPKSSSDERIMDRQR